MRPGTECKAFIPFGGSSTKVELLRPAGEKSCHLFCLLTSSCVLGIRSMGVFLFIIDLCQQPVPACISACHVDVKDGDAFQGRNGVENPEGDGMSKNWGSTSYHFCKRSSLSLPAGGAASSREL